jgi:hypothetical protein
MEGIDLSDLTPRTILGTSTSDISGGSTTRERILYETLNIIRDWSRCSWPVDVENGNKIQHSLMGLYFGFVREGHVSAMSAASHKVTSAQVLSVFGGPVVHP